MNNILDWHALVSCYGNELIPYKRRFEKAGESTSALLCCRYANEGSLIKESGGLHAEQKLLETEMWTTQIPLALKNWIPLGTNFLASVSQMMRETHSSWRNRIVTTMIINRTPCHNCAKILVNALNQLHNQYSIGVSENYFILACKGIYIDKKYEIYTRYNDLVRLKQAGWVLRVLQVEGKMSDRGKELLEALDNIN